jgi:hypothetical protein
VLDTVLVLRYVYVMSDKLDEWLGEQLRQCGVFTDAQTGQRFSAPPHRLGDSVQEDVVDPEIQSLFNEAQNPDGCDIDHTEGLKYLRKNARPGKGKNRGFGIF